MLSPGSTGAGQGISFFPKVFSLKKPRDCSNQNFCHDQEEFGLHRVGMLGCPVQDSMTPEAHPAQEIPWYSLDRIIWDIPYNPTATHLIPGTGISTSCWNSWDQSILFAIPRGKSEHSGLDKAALVQQENGIIFTEASEGGWSHRFGMITMNKKSQAWKCLF